MDIARSEGDEAAAMSYLTAYCFLLRVPSEGLPLITGGRPLEPLDQHQHSAIAMVGDDLILSLKRRKNMPNGAVLRRRCTCDKSKLLCPVHVLGVWLAQFAGTADGCAPFSKFSAGFANSELKRRVAIAGCQGAQQYTLHAFRRGHAQDIAENGGDLQYILSAGQWSSKAFLDYLNKVKLDSEAVAEAQVCLSDSDSG